MILFVPAFEGEISFDALPDDAIARIRVRVEEGLFQPGRRARADYRVISADRDAITFAAGGFLTAYAIGLNEVTVRRIGRNQLGYRVTYWRWTLGAVTHGLLLGIVLALLYAFVPSVRHEAEVQPGGVIAFGVIAGFFCLVWPWLLSAFHRPFAERALRDILRQVVTSTPARAA